MELTPEQRDEIDAARGQSHQTRRVTVEAMEEVLYQPLAVLDHGFVRVIDYMGDDAAIVQAARVSYGKGTRQSQDDAGLIRYLMRHRHTTPFEMCEVKFHVKLPIFVARQWIRHRTANVNEYSARYSLLDREYYMPAPEQICTQSSSNHQGRAKPLGTEEAAEVLRILREDAERTYANYQHMLNEDGDGNRVDPGRQGLARELARMNLTLNTYTQWYWKIDLHNLLHFLGLRADAHAQYEIRVYAEAILDLARRWVPVTCAAFEDYRKGGVQLSAKGLDVVKRLISGEAVTPEASGMSKREWRELMEVLGRDQPDLP
jgi:thymidylate synthase (FAD)